MGNNTATARKSLPKAVPRAQLRALVVASSLGKAAVKSSSPTDKISTESNSSTERQTKVQAQMEAFDRMFPQTMTAIRESDFLSAMSRVVAEQQFLSATITSYGAVNNLVHRVAHGISVGVIGLCVLLIWEIDVTSALVTLATLLLALSFAIGSTVSSLVAGASFVLLTAPFGELPCIYSIWILFLLN